MNMTPGEKAAAEWEARHDTRARGARSNPAAVQEYLQHERSIEQEARRSPPARRSGAPAKTPAPSAGTPRRSWLRRLLRRRT